MKKVIDEAVREWRGPKEGGNPTLAAFVKEALEEKIEREKAKGPQ